MILLPEALVHPILKHLYEHTHYLGNALMNLIRPHLKDSHLQRIQKIIQACQIHAKSNSKTKYAPTGNGVQYKGICPF